MATKLMRGCVQPLQGVQVRRENGLRVRPRLSHHYTLNTIGDYATEEVSPNARSYLCTATTYVRNHLNNHVYTCMAACSLQTASAPKQPPPLDSYARCARSDMGAASADLRLAARPRLAQTSACSRQPLALAYNGTQAVSSE
eukprot:6191982-Pleurochrysis_carterae.AAC.1